VPGILGWLVLGTGALVASTIGGVAGFGGGAIMIPLIAWTMGAKATVPVLTVGMLLGNEARVWFSRREIEGRVVVAFLVAAVPTSIAGARCSTRTSRAAGSAGSSAASCCSRCRSAAGSSATACASGWFISR